MRRQLLIAVIMLALLPVTGQSQTQVPQSETAYPYVVGASVIAGMVLAQATLFGRAGFPFFAGSIAPGAAIAAEVSVGVSRMYAVTSAVSGAWIANWFYDH